MKPEIVLLKAIYEPTVEALSQHFHIHRSWTAENPVEFLKKYCSNVRAAISTTTTEVTRAHFEALPHLELLACYGPYYTLIDLAAAKSHHVDVTYTPDSTAEPVADLAMGLIVAVMRRICEADRFIRSAKWPKKLFPSGFEVRGKTCGIIGMGRIGCEIATRAEAFGMKIVYHGPRAKPQLPYPYFSDLLTMAEQTDCLVVACALTETTRHLINAKVLKALGAKGFLVNISRGLVVDESALIEALSDGTIAGAALDVFANEPHVSDLLLQRDNVVLTPHMGTSTLEIREGRSQKLLSDVSAHFNGKPLTYKVNP
ncbi:MAG: 2-hydroxyacid dehydrogenase [Betaproteobacteria bacterium]|jgi:hydroxypyruvate reductase 2